MVQKDNRKEKHEFNKLQKRLRRHAGNAIADYNMIEEGDVIMACMSGGKDSYVMLDILLQLKDAAPVNFDVIAVNVDQKLPGFPTNLLPDYFKERNIPYYVVEKDTHAIVQEKIDQGKTPCGLCSRLRRGTIYSFAERMGATKIALGHHMDDIVETLFLNMFNGARMKAMPPKLRSDDGRNVVIRPLTYCREKDIVKYSNAKQYPIIPHDLCGVEENVQRQNIKAMLTGWDKKTPGRIEQIFKSLQNVSPSQLADKNIFDFENLPLNREGERGQYAFEEALVSSSNIDESMFINVKNV